MGKKGSATRRRIMDAAEHLVLEKGFSATSIDSIQEQADISRGTFFYHFSSKDDLSKAIIRRYAEVDFETVNAMMSRAEKLMTDALGQLILFISLHEEMFEQMTRTFPGCLFASYAYEASLFDEETEGIVIDSLEHWRKLVGSKVQQVLDDHDNPPDIKPEQIADYMYSVLQGAFILSRLYDDNNIIVTQLHLLRLSIEKLFYPES